VKRECGAKKWSNKVKPVSTEVMIGQIAQSIFRSGEKDTSKLIGGDEDFHKKVQDSLDKLWAK